MKDGHSIGVLVLVTVLDLGMEIMSHFLDISTPYGFIIKWNSLMCIITVMKSKLGNFDIENIES